MSRARRGMSPTLAGAIAGILIALVIGTMASIDASYGAPWASTHTLHVQVSDSDALTQGSDVRIAGRLAGQVKDVQASGGHAEITITVDSSEWPLPSNTTAAVRLATLLGSKYIELDPGNASGKLADDATISLQATKPVVDFDQLLDTFDQPTRDSLTALVRTLGTPKSGALAGEQDTLQQLIPALSNLSVTSQVPTQELATRDPELNGILANLATTSDSLAAARTDLAATIDSLNRITGALASHPSALPGFIVNTDLLNRTTTAVLGNGSAAQLNAGLKQLPALTAQLDTLLNTLVPESSAFANSPANAASTRLIYEIGDATSQSDQSGYFLRQNTAGVDISGLTPPTGPPPAPPSGSQGSPSAPTVPSAPALPGLPSLPALPSLPSVPGVPSIPGVCVPPVPGVAPAPTPTPAPGATPCPSASAPSVPGSVPVPTPAPICVLNVCLSAYTLSPSPAPASVDELLWLGGAG